MMDGRPEPSKSPDDDNEQQTSSAQVPAAVGGFSRKIRVITLGVCLCVIAAGVSVAVFSSAGGRQAGHIAGAGNSLAVTKNRPAVTNTQQAVTKARAARPAARSASSRVTTGPAVTRDGIAKSALRWMPRFKHQILHWKEGSGGTALAAVNEWLGNATQAAGVKLYANMRLACAGLASGISTAQAGPPIPDHAMQRLYAEALAGLSRAAADCRTAISVHAVGDESVGTHVNEVFLNRSRVEFVAMSKKLYRATAEIWPLR